MCRGIDHGGRRCPSSDPEVRAVKRKAKKSMPEPGPEFVEHESVPPPRLSALELMETRKKHDALFEAAVEDWHASHKQSELPTVSERIAELEALGDAEYDSELEELRKPYMRPDDSAWKPMLRGAVSRLKKQYPYAHMDDHEFLKHVGASIADAAIERSIPGGLEELERTADSLVEDSREWRKLLEKSNDLATQVMNTPKGDPKLEELRKISLEHVDKLASIKESINEKEEFLKISQRAIGDAYIAELSKVRKFGGSFQFMKGSGVEAVASFQRVSDYYPSDWIEASNSDKRMLNAKVVKTRAHYRHIAKGKKTYEVVPESWSRDLHTKEKRDEYLANNPSTVSVTVEPHPDDETRVLFTSYEVAQRTYMRNPDDPDGDWLVMTNPNKKPKGNRWELYTHPDGTQDWRRQKQFRHLTGTSYDTGSEILTSPDTPMVKDNMDSTSIHELAHRMEAVIPEIAHEESKLWHSRANGEEPTRIPGAYGADEKGVKDDYVHAYMGKYYPNGESFEILSMGMESLFFGRNGSLMGLSVATEGRSKKDTEMRDFILGVLAMTGRKEPVS